MSVLSKNDIPNELWQDDALRMPGSLEQTYETLLVQHGVMDAARDLTNPDNVIGGLTIEETLQHFARKLGVNFCRIESLILDPEKAFSTISDDLITIFSEGKIAMLDLACGTGSVGASVLSTLCALRKENVLPKTPTSVRIVGGDCSTHALGIYTEMMTGITQEMESNGIRCQLETVNWAAESSQTTSALFDQLFDRYPDADEYLVFVANFSGALDPHFMEYEDSVKHMFDRTYGKCTIIWVEPADYNRAKRLFKKLQKLVARTPWFNSRQTGPLSHEYEWFHPFQNRKLSCRVLVKAYNNS